MLIMSYDIDKDSGVSAHRTQGLLLYLKNKKEVEVYSRINLEKENHLSWVWGVLLKILQTNKKTIYISVGPFYPLIILPIILKLKGKKLIVDFRDPWSLNIKNGYGKKKRYSKIKYILASLIEKRIYKKSDSFIVCTIGMYDAYKEKFKDSEKIRLVENGFDFNPRRYNQDETIDKYLKVVCIGKFAEYNEDMAKESLIKAEELAKIKNKELKVKLIGSDFNINYQLIKKMNMVDSVEILGRRSYDSALEIASKSDLAMLTLRDENIEYGTKVFDYIGLRIPIIDVFDHKKNFYKSFAFNIYPNKIDGEDDVLAFHRQNIFRKNKNIYY